MTIDSSDPVSHELRAIEKEIDNQYKTNPLISLPFGISAWHLLAYYEDKSLFSMLNHPGASMHEVAAIADNLVVELQYSLYWLWKECPKGGDVPQHYRDGLYGASHELSQLASNYMPFAAAFTYASNQFIKLELQGTTIMPVHAFSDDWRYEAYGRLVKQEPLIPDLNRGELMSTIERSVTVSEYAFKYKLGRRLVEAAKRSLNQLFESTFELPKNWRFPYYSLAEFRQMSKSLVALSFIHFLARFLAASKKCKGLGLYNSLIVTTKDDLAWKLGRYSNVTFEIAHHFIDDLTYGGRGIRQPDPALQPLIKAIDQQYIIMPSLLIASSMERNFAVLLNRLPREKQAYLKLVQEKEILMRAKIQSSISIPDLRYFQGRIEAMPHLPDIDFAIISDQEKIVMIAELKWLIEPSDPREVIEKSREIEKGISQLLSIAEGIKLSPAPFFSAMGINESYEVIFLLLSENFIGFDKSQHPVVPVLRSSHVIKKINSFGNLCNITEWLVNRRYLPVENRDFTVFDSIWRIGNWGINWYAIKPLREYEFI